MEVLHTRLRLVKSKMKTKLLLFVNTLSYRIEIKGAPTYCPIDKKWCLWFIPDDEVELSNNLEQDLD